MSARASSRSTARSTRRRTCSRWRARTAATTSSRERTARTGSRSTRRCRGSCSARGRSETRGFEINPDETALKMIPLASVEVSDEAAEVNEALVEKLLELEDVDAVYTQ